MNHLKIRVQSVKDAEQGTPIFEGIDPLNLVRIDDFTVGFLEKGTVNGRMSIMFCLKDETGRVYLSEITQTNFEGLIAVFEGVKQRFGE